jgi:predicted small lipoprotein YifL
MIARLTIAAVFLASVALAGCGKLGELEQPAPMFGAQAKADYAAQHRAEDAARARAQAARQPSPEQNGNTPDPNALPLHEAPYAPPIPGRTDPNGPSGPPTALPTPGQPSADQ